MPEHPRFNIEQTFPLLQLNQLAERANHSTLKRGTRRRELARIHWTTSPSTKYGF